MKQSTKKLIDQRQEFVTRLLFDNATAVDRSDAARYINSLCKELGASDIPTPINRVRNFIGKQISAAGNFVAASPSNPCDEGKQPSS